MWVWFVAGLAVVLAVLAVVAKARAGADVFGVPPAAGATFAPTDPGGLAPPPAPPVGGGAPVGSPLNVAEQLAALATLHQRGLLSDAEFEQQKQQVLARGEAPPTVSVIMTATGRRKIQVIKVIKDYTRLDLKSAKELTDEMPSTIVSGLTPAEAGAVVASLTAAGATCQIR